MSGVVTSSGGGPPSNPERLARAEVAKRVVVSPTTPDDALHFDREDPDDLERHGLPTKPSTPGMRRVWDAMWEPRPRFVKLDKEKDFGFVDTVQHRTAGEAVASHSAAEGAAAGRWGTSRNWSGAVISARDSKSFARAAATWTVPIVSAPAGPGPQPVPGGRYQTSVWMGLDGYRRASKSLPQVGTVSEIAPGGADTYYLFVQWWVRGKFYGEVKVDVFPVSGGDRILAMMEVQSSTAVRFFVVNRGGPAGPRNIALVLDWQPGDYWGNVKAPVEGWHAEWCVERPSTMPPEIDAPDAWKHVKLFRLPTFQEATFDVALAEMRGPSHSSAPPVERDLTATRWLRMSGSVEGAFPPRTAILTSPLFPQQSNFTVHVKQR